LQASDYFIKTNYPALGCFSFVGSIRTTILLTGRVDPAVQIVSSRVRDTLQSLVYPVRRPLDTRSPCPVAQCSSSASVVRGDGPRRLPPVTKVISSQCWCTSTEAATASALATSPCSTLSVLSALHRRYPDVVLSVQYRLAPEYRLPAAIEDAATFFSWLRAGAGRSCPACPPAPTWPTTSSCGSASADRARSGAPRWVHSLLGLLLQRRAHGGDGVGSPPACLCAYSTVVGRPVLCLLPLGGLAKRVACVLETPTTQHLLDSMNRNRGTRIDN
jgi:hypothetical protein